MTLRDVVKAVDLEVISGQEHLDRDVTGCYASDLLSDVMSNSKAGHLWITLQVHQNIVAVASLRELVGVVVIGGRKLLDETVEKAREHGLPILQSPLPAFELSGRLYQAGLRGLE